MAERKQIVKDEAATELPLHVKYRPRRLGDVWGQSDVVKSLNAAILSKTRPHAYAFTGSAGVGKTTLARIVADMCGCSPENIIEADAATNSGIDAMREITSTLQYKGFGETTNKFVIIDEAHGLSKQAWDSLLKVLEEPPSHVYFALCTTNVAKVPATILSRCARYSLGELSKDDLFDLLVHVCKQERFDTADDILDIVVRSSEGSPRRALTALAMVHDCPTQEEAATLLAQPLESADVIEMCRLIVDNRLTWDRAVKVLEGLKDEDPESLRLIIVNYLGAVLLKTTAEKRAVWLLRCLDAFKAPCNRSEKMAPMLLAVGDICFGAGA